MSDLIDYSKSHAPVIVWTNLNSSPNITTAAFTVISSSAPCDISGLVASVGSSSTSSLDLYIDPSPSGGETMILSIGTGNNAGPSIFLPVRISKGHRILVKAGTANITTGNSAITFYGSGIVVLP